jgi:hypothetical protein
LSICPTSHFLIEKKKFKEKENKSEKMKNEKNGKK